MRRAGSGGDSAARCSALPGAARGQCETQIEAARKMMAVLEQPCR